MATERYKTNLEAYDRLVETIPNLKRKGKTMPYTSSNGYMFSLLSKEAEFGIRLSKEQRAAFGKEYPVEVFMSYGAVMRDYVLIPDSLLQQPEKLGKYLQQALEYVNSLPPK